MERVKKAKNKTLPTVYEATEKCHFDRSRAASSRGGPENGVPGELARWGADTPVFRCCLFLRQVHEINYFGIDEPLTKLHADHEDMTTADLLRQLEQSLLDPALRRDPDRVAALLADDFTEIGSSGRIFSRTDILDQLKHEPTGDTLSLHDFAAQEIAPGIALVTYRTVRSDAAGTPIRQALRSSLWIHREGLWQMRFHQGTPLP